MGGLAGFWLVCFDVWVVWLVFDWFGWVLAGLAGFWLVSILAITSNSKGSKICEYENN